MIVNYDYYINTYKGTKVSEENFEKIEIKASSHIMSLIMNRDYTNWFGKDYSEQVKMATCSVIDILNDTEQKEDILYKIEQGQKISSEKVGDYSRNFETINYKELQEQISNNEIKIVKEVNNYLWNTGLMNRGVSYVR